MNVTVKVLSPLWVNRAAYAYPVAQFETYTGPVVDSPSWVGDDSICIGTGSKRFPFRVIERSRIVEYGEAKAPMNVSKTETFVKQKKFFTNIPRRARMNNKLKLGNGPRLPNEVTMAKVKSTSVEKHGDKTRIAIEIMEANVGRSYDEVSQMIADAIGVDIGRARVYYRHKVINGLAKGYSPDVRPWEVKGGRTATAKAPKAPKATKATKVKFKDIQDRMRAKAAKAEVNLDEVARIKEANLERMREVTEKLKPKGRVRDYGVRVAREENDGVSDFDPTLAREEVDAILRDERLLDVCPKFVREDV